ncbi:MAG: response regulator, partial [Verrucomicrobia bacterium]|nr:response regulator [Verrucomicrobiota bacterium]
MNAQQGGILVLDDDTRVCRSLARLLGGAGYRVETFSTPQALLATKAVSEPACLILDLRLGTTHGMDLLQALKDGERELAVIILTAYG